jgi:hypothetical protein
MQAIMNLRMKQNSWVRLLTYVTGLVNQELLRQNEYLAAENAILRGAIACTFASLRFASSPAG